MAGSREALVLEVRRGLVPPPPECKGADCIKSRHPVCPLPSGLSFPPFLSSLGLPFLLCSSGNPTAKMKIQYSALLALAASVAASPTRTVQQKPRQASSGCSSAVTLNPQQNPFKKYTLHPNSFYRKEVEDAAANMTDSSLAESAKKVADVGSFLWL
jgi:hypothetical protein